MQISSWQRSIIVGWLLLMMIMFLVIPYAATYEDRSGEVYVDAGYGWVFQRPKYSKCLSAVEAHFGRQIGNPGSNCRIWPDFRRLALTLFAATSGSAAILGLFGFAGGAIGNKRGRVFPTRFRPESETKRPAGLAAELLAVAPDLPILEGDATEARPLVIAETTNYVQVEYILVEMIQQREPSIFFKFESQQVIERDGRKIDVLSYRHKVGSSASWDGVKKYYFDVTDCYRARAD